MTSRQIRPPPSSTSTSRTNGIRGKLARAADRARPASRKRLGPLCRWLARRLGVGRPAGGRAGTGGADTGRGLAGRPATGRGSAGRRVCLPGSARCVALSAVVPAGPRPAGPGSARKGPLPRRGCASPRSRRGSGGRVVVSIRSGRPSLSTELPTRMRSVSCRSVSCRAASRRAASAALLPAALLPGVGPTAPSCRRPDPLGRPEPGRRSARVRRQLVRPSAARPPWSAAGTAAARAPATPAGRAASYRRSRCASARFTARSSSEW